MRRGKRITSMTVFVSVDHDGDESIAMMENGPMMAVHDRDMLTQLRAFMHEYAIAHGEHVREVVFVRATGKRYHCQYDHPDDAPWVRGTEYQLIDLFHDECDDPDCHRRHVYMNYTTNRAVDAARGRKLRPTHQRRRRADEATTGDV